LKKEVEISEVNFGSIIPNLIYVIFEKKEKDNDEEIETLQTFQQLKSKINDAIEVGANIRVEFHFTEDNNINKGSINTKKTGFSFGLAAFNKLISKFSSVSNLSLGDITKNPKLVDPTDKDMEYIQKEVLDVARVDESMVRKTASIYLRNKFFPPELRSLLWMSVIKNPTRLNDKWYNGYKAILKARDNYGSADMISKKIEQMTKVWMMEEDKEFNESCLRMMLIFELNQPDVGYVPGMEKIAMFLRKISSEVEAFIVMFNMIFAYPFVWGIYNQEHTSVHKS